MAAHARFSVGSGHCQIKEVCILKCGRFGSSACALEIAKFREKKLDFSELLRASNPPHRGDRKTSGILHLLRVFLALVSAPSRRGVHETGGPEQV